MPCLELDELLAIGEYLLNNDKIPVEMHDLYSQEKIKERFNEYGGIYRHVFPYNESYLFEIARQKISSINDLTNKKIESMLLNPNIEDQTISDFLLQYKVLKEGDDSFENYSVEFVNDNMFKILENFSNELSLRELKIILIKADSKKMNEINARILYQEFIAKMHSFGFNWFARKNTNENWNGKYRKYISQMIYESPPTFEEMDENILYFPLHENFTLGDMFYKLKEKQEVVLVVIEVSRKKTTKKQISLGELELFKKRFGLKNLSNVHYLYFPLPELASTAVVEITDDLSETQKNIFANIHIVKVPLNYGFIIYYAFIILFFILFYYVFIYI
jgi:hypothetical protein